MSDMNYYRNGKKITKEEFFNPDKDNDSTAYIVVIAVVVFMMILIFVVGS